MRNTKKFTAKLCSILALVLALLLPASALAEGGIATDLAGGFGAADSATMAANDAQQIDIMDAELRIGYVAQYGASLNPFMCNEWDLVSMNQLVFEPLVTLDENQKPSPMLADNWQHEGKKWVFTLRSNISFHNGQPLTAYDVQATYDQFMQMNEGDNPYTTRMKQMISSLVALDERTVKVEAKYEGYITLYAMNFPVIQQNTIFDDMPRGTGPYWYVRYDLDSAVRIEANPLWWQQPPTLSSITFCRYDSSGDAIEGLQTNGVEMLSTRSNSAAICRKLADLTSMDYATWTYELMVPNLNSGSAISNVRVRQAVMYAIDRAALAANAYLGMGIQCEVPVNPSSWLYESQSAIYYYSPERALQLLYDSGWKDLTGDAMMNKLDGIMVRDLTIDIVTYNESTSSIRENAANLIAGYLNAVGIKTTVTVLTQKRALSRIDDRDYDLALIGVNLSEVPVLQSLLSAKGNLNLNRYNNEEMENLINMTATAADEASLKAVYSQIQMTLVERLPIMGLLFRTGTVLSTRSLGGLTGIRALNTFRGMEYLSK